MRRSIYNFLRFFFCTLILVLNFSQTYADTTAKLQNQFKELQKEVKKFKKEKNPDKVRSVYPEMWTVYTKMYNDPQISKKEKLNAGLIIVQTYISEGECKKALDLCEKLFALPELSPGEKVKIQCVIADLAKSCGQYKKAVMDYEKALGFPGIDNADKLYVYGKIATVYWRDDRNPDKLKKVIEKMLPLSGKSGKINRWLIILANFRFPNNSYTASENVEFAWSRLLEQDKVSAKHKAAAYSGLIEAQLRLRKVREARQVAETTKADKSIPAKTRLSAAYVILGIDAIEQKRRVSIDAIRQAERGLSSSKMDQYNALNDAAAALRNIKEGRVAQQFSLMAKKLVERPIKTYTCRYVKKAPLGACGWLASKLINDSDFRETRFNNYSQKDAAALVTDVNAERSTSTKAKNKAYYFKNTAFYMAYDQNGWHIFVLCREPKIKQMLLDDKSPGALEMYFAPGADRAYYQWIIRLNNGKTDTYDWNSPHRYFRPAEDYIKTETVVSDDMIGTYIFFPWEMVYDKLPFDSNKDWIFEMIRWSPAGGISWSGGKVHNTGKWGQIKWQPPTPERLLQIKKNLLRKAWGKYKNSRKELVDDHWAKRDFGDPEFLKTTLMPEVKRLNKLGEALENPDKLSDADINRLFKNAISDWMEFEYKVSELRKEYLSRRLTMSSTEVKD